MSTGTASPTGSPSADAIHDFISDTWLALTQSEALARLSQMLENKTRVRDAGVTPSPAVPLGTSNSLHGIGAINGSGSPIVNVEESDGFFSDEESDDLQIEKWLSKRQKVLFGYS